MTEAQYFADCLKWPLHANTAIARRIAIFRGRAAAASIYDEPCGRLVRSAGFNV
jgi:hypothetical protein